VSSIVQTGIFHNFIDTDNEGEPLSNFGINRKINFGVGFDVNFSISEPLHMKTGLRYYRTGYKSFSINDEVMEGPHGIIIDPLTPETTISTYDYIFLEIPMILRFESKKGKLEPFLEVGFTNNVYMKSSYTTKTFLYTTSTDIDAPNTFEDFYRIQTALVVSLGFNYVWNEQFKLFCQTTYKYHLQRISKNPLSYRFYTFGMEFGIRRLIDLGKTKKKNKSLLVVNEEY
jgi:hypothetical protein